MSRKHTMPLSSYITPPSGITTVEDNSLSLSSLPSSVDRGGLTDSPVPSKDIPEPIPDRRIIRTLDMHVSVKRHKSVERPPSINGNMMTFETLGAKDRTDKLAGEVVRMNGVAKDSETKVATNSVIEEQRALVKRNKSIMEMQEEENRNSIVSAKAINKIEAKHRADELATKVETIDKEIVSDNLTTSDKTKALREQKAANEKKRSKSIAEMEEEENDLPIVTVNAMAIEKIEAEQKAEDLAAQVDALENELRRYKSGEGMSRKSENGTRCSRAGSRHRDQEAAKEEKKNGKNKVEEEENDLPVVNVNAMAKDKIEAEEKAAELAAQVEALECELRRYRSTDSIPMKSERGASCTRTGSKHRDPETAKEKKSQKSKAEVEEENDLPIVTVNAMAIDKIEAEEKAAELAAQVEALECEVTRLKSMNGVPRKSENGTSYTRTGSKYRDPEHGNVAKSQKSKAEVLEEENDLPIVTVNAMAKDKIEAEEKAAELAAQVEALECEVTRLKSREGRPKKSENCSSCTRTASKHKHRDPETVNEKKRRKSKAEVEEENGFEISGNVMTNDKFEAEEKAAELAAQVDALESVITRLKSMNGVPRKSENGTSYTRTGSKHRDPETAKEKKSQKSKAEMEEEENDLPIVTVNAMAIDKIEAEQKAAELADEVERLRLEIKRLGGSPLLKRTSAGPFCPPRPIRNAFMRGSSGITEDGTSNGFFRSPSSGRFPLHLYYDSQRGGSVGGLSGYSDRLPYDRSMRLCPHSRGRTCVEVRSLSRDSRPINQCIYHLHSRLQERPRWK